MQLQVENQDNANKKEQMSCPETLTTEDIRESFKIVRLAVSRTDNKVVNDTSCLKLTHAHNDNTCTHV